MLSFLIYLIGCFIAYASLSRSKMRWEPDQEWTNSDRKICLFYSILSWIGVLAAIYTNIFFSIATNIKPSDDKFFNRYIVPFLKRFEKEK